MAVTESILESLGASDKPILYVFNKIDKCPAEKQYDLRFYTGGRGRVVTVSVKEKIGYDELISQLEALCRYGKTREYFMFPYTDQKSLNTLYNMAEIISTEYTDEGTLVYAWVDERAKGTFSRYLKKF